MTADASLPPADEQRQPPLGDEELAAMDRFSQRTSFIRRPDFLRLIAALRASRAELATYKELVWGNECGCVGSAFRRAGIPYE